MARAPVVEPVFTIQNIKNGLLSVRKNIKNVFLQQTIFLEFIANKKKNKH